jgi:hypothetical protein
MHASPLATTAACQLSIVVFANHNDCCCRSRRCQGGKSPTIVDSTCDLRVAARRIAFGKFLNAGQSCIAPDYILVDARVEQQFTDELQRVIEEMFGADAQASESFGRIINARHFQRIESLLAEMPVVYGGKLDGNDLFVGPTIVSNPPLESRLMSDEIFAPILPIIRYDQLDQAIDIINDRYVCAASLRREILSADFARNQPKAFGVLHVQLQQTSNCTGGIGHIVGRIHDKRYNGSRTQSNVDVNTHTPN